MRLPRNVRLLGWASLLNDIASEMVFPLLPLFLQSIGASLVSLGAIEGAADLAASLVKLWSGAASDRRSSRKGFVVVGYVLATLARALIGLVTGPWQALGLRVTDRIGKGIRTAPRDALLADATDDTNRGRAFGFHRGMDHLGAAIGPLIAFAFLAAYPGQFRWLFLLTLVPGAFVVALLAFGLREAQPVAKPESRDASVPSQRLNGPFTLFLVAVFLFTLGCVSETFLLVRAKELGVVEKLLPVLWCAFHVLKSGGNLIVGRWVHGRTAGRWLLASWGVGAVLYGLFAFAFQTWHAWALFAGYAGFCALKEPSEKTLVAALVGPARKGAAFGWFHLTLGVAGLPAGLLFGFLYERHGAVTAFLTGAGWMILAGLAWCVMSLFSVSRTGTAGDN